MWANPRRNCSRSWLRLLMTANLLQEVHLQRLLVMLSFYTQMTHKGNSIWFDSPGGLAPQLSGGPKPVHRNLPLVLKGVVGLQQRMAGSPPQFSWIWLGWKLRKREHGEREGAVEKDRQMANNRSICCNGDEKSWQCQEKALCWAWKHWRALLALVVSSANESYRERWGWIGGGG